jgi:hypothetical protein
MLTEAKQWAGLSSLMHLDSPQPHYRRLCVVEYIWKSTSYDRMQNALKTFAIERVWKIVYEWPRKMRKERWGRKSGRKVATCVTSDAKCARRYGSLKKTNMIPGIVFDAEVEQRS